MEKQTKRDLKMELFIKKIISFVLLLIFGITFTGFSQQQQADIDSAFAGYMDEAWEEIRAADSLASDSLQRVHSKKFYDYYRQHPKTETGKKAFSNAFLMWGNTGNDQYVDEALETLDKDSETWSKIIQSLSNIYYRSEERDMESFDGLLVELKKELTNPISQSAVIENLIRREEAAGNNNKVKKLAEELIDLDASPFYVNYGEGYLHEMTKLRVGQKAVNFEAKTLNGENVSLSEMEGKLVLLDFWATWCGPCIPEIPNLKMLSEKYDNDKFEIISISLDQDKEALTEMIEEKEIEWKQVHQEKTWEGEIAEFYNVAKLPRKYLINPEGEIVAKDIRGEEMIEEVEKQMSK